VGERCRARCRELYWLHRGVRPFDPIIEHCLTLQIAMWIHMVAGPNGKASVCSHRRLQLNDGRRIGFVAIVDKEMSTKYEKLVNDAPRLIKDLPWGPDFEVDVFRKPDFTALQIVSFATGGIPAGINVCTLFRSRITTLTRLIRSQTTTRFVNLWDSRTSHLLSVPVSFLRGVLRLTSEIEHPSRQGPW
jgi:hypothetical protein